MDKKTLMQIIIVVIIIIVAILLYVNRNKLASVGKSSGIAISKSISIPQSNIAIPNTTFIPERTLIIPKGNPTVRISCARETIGGQLAVCCHGESFLGLWTTGAVCSFGTKQRSPEDDAMDKLQLAINNINTLPTRPYGFVRTIQTSGGSRGTRA